MRCVILALLLFAASLLSACSYITDFVVANESDQPIEVRYRVKKFPGPFTPPAVPSTIETSQLSPKGSQQWHQLTSDGFQLDEDSRTVKVRVLPHQALRIATMHHYGGHDDSVDAQDFPVEEITIVGTNGEQRFVGQHARTTFSAVSRALYTLTYN